jgi:hypothetical protein
MKAGGIGIVGIGKVTLSMEIDDVREISTLVWVMEGKERDQLSWEDLCCKDAKLRSTGECDWRLWGGAVIGVPTK